jgi:hypothetical protein
MKMSPDLEDEVHERQGLGAIRPEGWGGPPYRVLSVELKFGKVAGAAAFSQ